MLAVRPRVGCRRRELVHGGGGGRRWLVGWPAAGLIRDGRRDLAASRCGHHAGAAPGARRGRRPASRGLPDASASRRRRWRSVGGGCGGGGDGEHDLDVDGGVAGDQVGEGFAAGLFDVGAGAGGDEVVGELVDGGPGGGGVFAGEGAVPFVDAGFGDPPAQPGVGAGSLRAFAHQVGGDALEQHPGAPPQGGGVVAEVARRGRRRWRRRRRRVRLRARTRPRRRGSRRAARRPSPGAARPDRWPRARRGRRPAPGPDPRPGARPARRGAAPRRARPRSPGRPGRPRRGATRPGACTVSPRVPSSHQMLSRRAASAIAASCTAVRVLINAWQSPTTPSHSSRLRVAPGSASAAATRRAPADTASSSRTGCGAGRGAGGARRPLAALVRCDHVSPFPVTRFYRRSPISHKCSNACVRLQQNRFEATSGPCGAAHAARPAQSTRTAPDRAPTSVAAPAPDRPRRAGRVQAG